MATLGIAVGVALVPVTGWGAWAQPLPAGEPGTGVVMDTQPTDSAAELDSAIDVIAQGRTTVSGDGGSTVRIRVPADATLDLRRGDTEKTFAGADLDGTGPGFGFVLADNVATEDGGKWVYGWQLSDDFGGLNRRLRGGEFDSGDKERFLIPAGTYSLYLISDGSPVTVTLELGGLVESSAAAATATATRTVPLDFRQLRNRAPGGDTQDNVYSVGQKASFLDAPGFHAIAVATTTPGEKAVGVSGFCYYVGSVTNEDTAYLPGCPNEYTDGADADDPEVDGFMLQDARALSVPSGLYAMGFWRESSKPLEQMSAVGFALQYDPAFSPQ